MPNEAPKPQSRLGGQLGILSFTVFLDLVGFGMILPLLPFYAERFGASPFQVGLLFSAYSLAQFVSSPILGHLSDRLGRRPILLVSILGGCGAYLLFALTQGLTVLFIARTLAGLAAGNYGIAQAYVADVTRPESRAKAMGWLGAAFGLGFIFGPALGGFLSYWGAAAVPLGAAVLSAGNFILVWAWLPEPMRHPDAGGDRPRGYRLDFDPLRSSAARASLVTLLTLYGVVIFGFSAMEATLALFCEQRLDFGIRETSWLFVFVGVLIVLVQMGLVGRLVSRYGEGVLLLVGIVVMAAGLLLLGRVETVPTLLSAIAFLAVGSGLHNPAAFSLMSRLAPADSQGGVLGLARSFGALARVAGPIWGGWSFHHLGSMWPFLSAGGLLAASAIVVLRLLPKLRFSSTSG